MTGMQVVKIQSRCTEDQVDDNEGAKARFQWAIKCGFIHPNAEKLFTHEWSVVDMDWVERAKYSYPIFAYDKENNPIWKPDLSECNMPVDVFWLTNCQTGCYEASQQILFADGFKSIKEAIVEDDVENGGKIRQRLIVVDESSTEGNLIYTEAPVSYYTRDFRETDHNLLKFVMQSGNTLTVTDNHPLLSTDGFVVEADKFQPGDALVAQDGSHDVIQDIQKVTIRGIVYNVDPLSRNPVRSLVVAEGYLNGSGRYQNGSIQMLDRIVVRLSVPDDLL